MINLNVLVGAAAALSDGTMLQADLSRPDTETFVLGPLQHGYIGQDVPQPHIARIPTQSDYTSYTISSSDDTIVTPVSSPRNGVRLLKAGSASLTISLHLNDGGTATATMDIVLDAEGLVSCVVNPTGVTPPPVVNPENYFAFRKAGGTSGIDQAGIPPLTIISKGSQTIDLTVGQTFSAIFSGYNFVTDAVVAGLVTGAVVTVDNDTVATAVITGGQTYNRIITAVSVGTTVIHAVSADGLTKGDLTVNVTATP